MNRQKKVSQSTLELSDRTMSSKTSDDFSTAGSRSGSSCGISSPFMVAKEALQCKIDEAAKSILSGKIGVGVACSGKWLNSGDRTKSVAIDTFTDLLESEINRITEYILQEKSQLEASARSLLASTDTTLSNTSKELVAEVANRLRTQADEISNQSLALYRFTKANSDILRLIAEDADALLETSSVTFVNSKLISSAWKGENGVVVAILSDIYDAIRAAEELSAKEGEGKGVKWVAPATFKRKTHKYLVQNDKIADVLHTVVAKLPLLVYGRTGRLTPFKQEGTARVNDGNYLWDNLVTPVTSVYFDSPDMVLYHDRIARNEGARLLRARWYGDQPKGDEVIFLELKTHHEKWVDMKTVKERVPIRECDMNAFLSTDDEWDIAEAKAAILAADHIMKGDKLNKATHLLLEMRKMVHELKLRPCVRTTYLRAAFQSPRNNDLRLTLDRNITMIREHVSQEGDWCLPDNANISVESITQLPCAVFEVKEAEDADTAFIDKLLETGVISDGYKFSKYQTGAATFNEVRVMPYWAEIPEVSSVFRTRLSSNLSEQSTLMKSKSECTGLTQRKVNLANDEKLPSDDASLNITNRLTENTDSRMSKQNNDSSIDVKDNDKQWKNKKYYWFLPDGLVQFMTREKEDKTKVARRTTAHVEPKSYFANERTFIQWATASFWLVTIALILLEMGLQDSKIVGLILCIVAMIISIYALATYFKRIKLMESKKPYGYVDHAGPVVLTMAILIGIILLLYYRQKTDSIIFINSDTPVKQVAGECMQHSLGNMSKLEYQPSDIVIDEKRGIMLIPSLSRITAVSLNFTGKSVSDQQVTILVNVPGKEFEGITYVDDKVYAVSEGETESELFEFTWDDTDSNLVITRQWKITTPGTEGIVHVPDSNGGKLYISGDHLIPGGNNQRASVDIYEVPSSENDEILKPVSRLNMKLMAQGLEDNKISAMIYFENVLYILHDNAHIVRTWDVTNGEFLSEWKLPLVEGGFGDQWEGLGFQWVNTTDASHPATYLRGNGNTGSDNELQPSLMLYLALDTPSQIWKFAVKPGEESSSITMPACAMGR